MVREEYVYMDRDEWTADDVTEAAREIFGPAVRISAVAAGISGGWVEIEWPESSPDQVPEVS